MSLIWASNSTFEEVGEETIKKNGYTHLFLQACSFDYSLFLEMTRVSIGSYIGNHCMNLFTSFGESAVRAVAC